MTFCVAATGMAFTGPIDRQKIDFYKQIHRLRVLLLVVIVIHGSHTVIWDLPPTTKCLRPAYHRDRLVLLLLVTVYLNNVRVNCLKCRPIFFTPLPCQNSSPDSSAPPPSHSHRCCLDFLCVELCICLSIVHRMHIYLKQIFEHSLYGQMEIPVIKSLC